MNCTEDGFGIGDESNDFVGKYVCKEDGTWEQPEECQRKQKTLLIYLFIYYSYHYYHH